MSNLQHFLELVGFEVDLFAKIGHELYTSSITFDTEPVRDEQKTIINYSKPRFGKCADPLPNNREAEHH